MLESSIFNVPIFYVKYQLFIGNVYLPRTNWIIELPMAHRVNGGENPMGKKQFLSAEAQEHILSDKNIQKLLVWIKQCQPSPSHHHFYRCYIWTIPSHGGSKWHIHGDSTNLPLTVAIFALTRVTFVWRFTVFIHLWLSEIFTVFCVIFDYSNHNLVGKVLESSGQTQIDIDCLHATIYPKYNVTLFIILVSCQFSHVM